MIARLFLSYIATRHIPAMHIKIPARVDSVSFSLRIRVEKGNRKRGETDNSTTVLPAPINWIAIIKRITPAP